MNDALEAAGCDETAEVIYLNSGAAPAYTEPVSRSELTMMGALKTDSGVVDGTLVATDARFLCWDPEGGMVMARPQVETTGDGTTSTYEEVWLYQLDGTREPLLDTAFSSVQKAAYSPDTRYIALLEQTRRAPALPLRPAGRRPALPLGRGIRRLHLRLCLGAGRRPLRHERQRHHAADGL